ncbi:unnamed protein product, partial [Tilletia laevis]
MALTAVPAAPTRSFYGTASSAPTASSNSAPLRILPDDPFEDPPDSPLFPVQRAARSPLADILDSSMELPEEHDAHSDDSSEEERSVEGASSADLVLPDDEGLGLGGDEYDDPDDLSYRTTSSDEDSEDEESEEGSSTAS